MSEQRRVWSIPEWIERLIVNITEERMSLDQCQLQDRKQQWESFTNIITCVTWLQVNGSDQVGWRACISFISTLLIISSHTSYFIIIIIHNNNNNNNSTSQAWYSVTMQGCFMMAHPMTPRTDVSSLCLLFKLTSCCSINSIKSYNRIIQLLQFFNFLITI